MSQPRVSQVAGKFVESLAMSPKIDSNLQAFFYRRGDNRATRFVTRIALSGLGAQGRLHPSA